MKHVGCSLLVGLIHFELIHLKNGARSDLIHRKQHHSHNPLLHHVPPLPPPGRLCPSDRRSPLHIPNHRTHPSGPPTNLLPLPPRMPRRINASRTPTSRIILARNRSLRHHHSQRAYPSRLRSRRRPMGHPPQPSLLPRPLRLQSRSIHAQECRRARAHSQ